MIVARIKVYDACALAEWANPITAGMVGAQVRIDYASEAWDGLTKTVVFSGAVTKDITTDDTIVEIPAECMAMAGVMLKVGVYGIAADETIAIPTLWAPIGRVLRGTDPSGDEETNPSLPVWAQILGKANTAEQIAQDLRQDAEDGRFNGRPGADGITPEKGVDYFTPSEVSEIEAGAAAKLEPELSKVKSDLAAEAKRAKEAEDNRVKKFYTSNLGAVSVPDSDDGAVRNLVIRGRSEQITTTGANLVDFRGFKGKGYGVKAEFDENGIGIVSGTPTITSGYVFTFFKNVGLSLLTIGDTYECIGGTGITITYEDGKDYNTRFKYTSDIKSVSFYIQRTAEKYIDGEVFKPMLRKVGSGVEWEPYTGGAPSPSPDYPQEIKSVENCSMIVSNADGTETQTAAIPFTLRGIGDVLDELYVYADGSGKLVRRYPDTLAPTMTVVEQALETPIETALTAEQVKALFELRTYYGGTNISYQSENGVEPVVNFDYACALENFVEYIKAAQGDDRKFIYDMDERMTDAEYVAALAYVNSEYAAALTELEV